MFDISNGSKCDIIRAREEERNDHYVFKRFDFQTFRKNGMSQEAGTARGCKDIGRRETAFRRSFPRTRLTIAFD